MRPKAEIEKAAMHLEAAYQECMEDQDIDSAFAARIVLSAIQWTLGQESSFVDIMKRWEVTPPKECSSKRKTQ